MRTEPVLGDVEIAEIGTLLADRSRCRVLMALIDGRALAASVLADEAGVARSTASSHLAKLTEAGFLRVETHGRHRYYRLAGPEVGELLEKLTQIAPARPVRSLRDGNRGAQLRAARTCYDHMAGRLGVGIMAHFVECRYLVGGDGEFHPESAPHDKIIGYGRDVAYELSPAGRDFIDEVGITIPDNGRSLIRYCVDWSEQRHHMAGRLGRAILDHFLANAWIARRPVGRSVQVTANGSRALADIFDISWN
ncbi:ArsR/SmtB family transcription factor [Actinocrispum wychmicini]|uniref:ArsR/SmtB family transcription factor n=1 Tax=Actinocrispum wychmicini TaxID=1213861 RepID=UPI001FB5F28F|nr:metalloregulator ArsR/SmtB family transcription factor [Actinocrispum wychmicini]